MPYETILPIAEQLCVKAVQDFADRLTSETSLSLLVNKVPEQTDVEFFNERPTKTVLRIEWAVEQHAETIPASEWEVDPDELDAEGEGYTASVQLMRHYSRMLEVLARNTEAAHSLLKNMSHRKELR